MVAAYRIVKTEDPPSPDRQVLPVENADEDRPGTRLERGPSGEKNLERSWKMILTAPRVGS